MGAKAVGDAHALLPALKFMTIELLEAAKVFEILILFVVVVEVEVAHLVETTRELAPRTLPLCIASLPASPAQTRTGTDVPAAVLASHWSANLSGTRLGFGIDRLGAVLGFFRELKQVGALHAVPVAIRNAVEADAVGVIGSIAAIAQQQNIFSFGRIADGAGIRFLLFLFGILAKPLLDVELGHLLLVLYCICRNGSS